MGRLHTRYAPVRHSSATIASTVTVRLACIKPAASVHPEPGSNSPFYLMFFELSFFSLSRLYRLRPQKKSSSHLLHHSILSKNFPFSLQPLFLSQTGCKNTPFSNTLGKLFVLFFTFSFFLLIINKKKFHFLFYFPKYLPDFSSNRRFSRPFSDQNRTFLFKYCNSFRKLYISLIQNKSKSAHF